MKTTFFLIGLSVLGLPLYAGDKGNGGDAIACADGSVRLLDKYEAIKRKKKIYIPGETLTQKVEILFERLETFDPFNIARVKQIGELLIKDLQNYENGSNDLQNVLMSTDILNDIDDSEETAIPSGCIKEQLVVNKSYVMPGDYKFEVRSDLWQRLDLEDKAMTVLHESLYQWLSKDDDSRRARYINGLISTELNQADWENYAELMEKEYIGVPAFFDLSNLDIISGTYTIMGFRKKEFKLLQPFSDYLPMKKVCFGENCRLVPVYSVGIEKNINHVSISIREFLEFPKKGKDKSAKLTFKNGGEIKLYEKTRFYPQAWIVTNKSGQVRQLIIRWTCGNIKSFEFSGTSYNDFYCGVNERKLVLNINDQNELTTFDTKIEEHDGSGYYF